MKKDKAYFINFGYDLTKQLNLRDNVINDVYGLCEPLTIEENAKLAEKSENPIMTQELRDLLLNGDKVLTLKFSNGIVKEVDFLNNTIKDIAE